MDQDRLGPAGSRGAVGQRQGRRRRGTALVAAGASLVLAAGVAVAGVRLADRPQPFGENDAVAAFRAAQAPPGAPGTAGGPASAGRDTGGTNAASPDPGSGASRAAASPGAGAKQAAAPAGNPAAPDVPSSGDRAGGAAPGAGSPSPSAATPRRPPAADDNPDPATRPVETRPRGVTPGVYRYATSGHEEVDALGGSRHDYPATTSVTYTATECGTDERWQPARERSTVARRCQASDGSLQVRSLLQQREFYGQTSSQELDCGDGLTLLPGKPARGQRWQGHCSSADTQAAVDGHVVALETVDVDGQAVPAVRVLLSTRLTGATRGRTDREVWLARTDGLLLKARGSTDTTADAVGGPVRYREQYALALLSTRPRR